jgi:hypothetical protein
MMNNVVPPSGKPRKYVVMRRVKAEWLGIATLFGGVLCLLFVAVGAQLTSWPTLIVVSATAVSLVVTLYLRRVEQPIQVEEVDDEGDWPVIH